MSKNRQLEILLYLLKVKKTTHRELATMFEVSIKTIQRDIDKLCVIGVPIICKQGNHGGIYIEENYKLSKSFLNNEDLQSITFALSIYDSLSTKQHKDNILNKLALIAPDVIHLYEKDASEYFVVDIFHEKINMTDETYKIINHSLDEEHCLQIEIGEEQLIIAPISYVLRSDGLYLYAFEKTYILIKISNLSNLETTDIAFERSFIPYEKNKNIAVK